MRQLTKQEAIEIYDAGHWKNWSDKEIVDAQLFQYRLCVPFGVFQGALTRVLGRPVFTHEFADPDRIRKEYLSLVK